MIELAADQEVGAYRILERVGGGEAGDVYRAVEPRAERVVALKVIHPEVAADTSFRERFRREISLAASLKHPNIVEIFEADEVGGTLFVAMRWIGGRSLGQLLAAERYLESARAVHIIGEIADALEAAHRQGLTHHDLKPANVLIEDGRAYLSGFAVAPSPAGAEALTRSAAFIGAADYCAPEVITGGPVDSRAEVYALGCILFEAVTGSLPFPVEGLLSKLHAHVHDPPPAASEIRAELPHELDEVVRRALAKDARERYPAMTDMARAAAAAVVPQPRRTSGGARTRHPGRRVGALVLASGVALATGLAGATLGGIGRSGASRSTAPQARAASLLAPCEHPINGPPRDCLTPGGVLEIGDEGRVLHMETLDIMVARVRVRHILRGLTGETVVAPRGTRFVVITATITNRTRSAHVFDSEPESVNGQQTMLELATASDRLESDEGPHYLSYSAEDAPTAMVLSRPVVGQRFKPGDSMTGQLLFLYPTAELSRAKIALLTIKEFGESLAGRRSTGGIRLPL